jgi:hypothetical protein
MYNQEDLKLKLLSELKTISGELGIELEKGVAKKDIIQKIVEKQAPPNGVFVSRETVTKSALYGA